MKLTQVVSCVLVMVVTGSSLCWASPIIRAVRTVTREEHQADVAGDILTEEDAPRPRRSASLTNLLTSEISQDNTNSYSDHNRPALEEFASNPETRLVRQKRSTSRDRTHTAHDSSNPEERRARRQRRSAAHMMSALVGLCDRHQRCRQVLVEEGDVRLTLQLVES